MGRKWTVHEEEQFRKALVRLYVTNNMSIREVGVLLHLAPQTVFQRLQRLNIPTQPERKIRYNNQRRDVTIPRERSAILAEFFGIMLGDGKLTPFQVIVTLGTKERAYAIHVTSVMQKLFNIRPKIAVRKTGYIDVYVGSVEISRWLQQEGLVFNKVLAQVDMPDWIFEKKVFMRSFLRGFFDTDGSVYKLKHGVQISLTNHSKPLLKSLQKLLDGLHYHPSQVSANKVYVTKREKVQSFFRVIAPKNPKHIRRFETFLTMNSDLRSAKNVCVGTQAVNEERL